MTWSIYAAYFTPGMLIGLVIGWFAIDPVNVVLRLGLPRLQSRLRSADRRVRLDRQRLPRSAVIVVFAYCGLLVLTYVFRDSPRGFVPNQDMGRIMVSMQLPDSAGLAHQEVTPTSTRSSAAILGVAHTIGLAGISFVEQANGSNFGSFFVILKPFAQRQDRNLRADMIMTAAAEAIRCRDQAVRTSSSSVLADPGRQHVGRLPAHGARSRRPWSAHLAGAIEPSRPRRSQQIGDGAGGKGGGGKGEGRPAGRQRRTEGR